MVNTLLYIIISYSVNIKSYRIYYEAEIHLGNANEQIHQHTRYKNGNASTCLKCQILHHSGDHEKHTHISEHFALGL